MGERRGTDTDRLAISELFRDRPDLRDAVIENYLEPRARRNRREKLEDRRDHFWTVPPTATPEQRAAAAKGADPLVVLVDNRLRDLKDTDWVSKATAAVYCGCSEPELDRRIRTDAIGGLRTLTRHRETKRLRKRDAQGRLVPGNLTERRFKMTAVKRLRGTRVPHRKSADAPPSARAPNAKPLTLKAAAKDGALVLTLRKALLDRVPWVVDAHGELVCHLTLTGLSAKVIAGFLAGGGTIERMPLRDALARPWAAPGEEADWASGYALLVKRDTDALGAQRSAARERHLQRALPPARVPTRRSRL